MRSMDKVTKSDLIRLLRIKCHYLDGFAAALGNAQLLQTVTDIRELLNKHEANEETESSINNVTGTGRGV